MRRILVPLDGTPESESILDEVVRIDLPDSTMDLLHVIPHLHSAASDSPAVDLNLEKAAEMYLDGVSRRVPSQRVRTWIWRGDAGEEITRAATTLKSDLIAMCTHARSSLSHLLLGSVTEAVVRESFLPVLLVRPKLESPALPLRRILVAIDGTDPSRHLVDSVRLIAKGKSPEIVFFHVVVPLIITDPVTGFTPVGIPQPPPDPVPALREDAEKLSSEGYRTRVEVVNGGAADQILTCAKSLSADLIVVGTSARQGLSHFFLGSVADEIIRHADRPVLVQRLVPAVGARTHESGRHSQEAD
ncbi:MAG TPA: universal stress protein [Planctomycetota bacterium]|nr:universal stress protein [Planctomycetota bacterium]